MLSPRVTEPLADPPRRITSFDTTSSELFPALLGAIEQVVAAAILEQMAGLVPTRLAPVVEVGIPQGAIGGPPEGGVVVTRALPTAAQGLLPTTPQEVPQQWLARLERLEKGLQDVQHQIAGDPGEEQQGVPFTDTVIANELPANCRTPAIAKLRNNGLKLSLFAVRQRNNKPLREYLQRFNTTALEVPSTTQEVKVSAFSQGLLDGDFFNSLARNPASKFDALLARRTKYINMEDARAAKKEIRGEKRKEAREETPFKKQRIAFRDKKAPFHRIHAVYTPLAVPITQARMANEGKCLLTRPRSWREQPQRPKPGKFFLFHNDCGHTTEECRHLKNEI
ncbi:UNVERIFIED_CONTAM: hypothetical protein Sindi_0540500 [Sesamum indicum]